MSTLNQSEINLFYKQVTAINSESSLKRLSHSGMAIVNKILPTESVIDVGCGNNLFKKFIPNLIGIDPVFDQAGVVYKKSSSHIL